MAGHSGAHPKVFTNHRYFQGAPSKKKGKDKLPVFKDEDEYDNTPPAQKMPLELDVTAVIVHKQMDFAPGVNDLIDNQLRELGYTGLITIEKLKEAVGDGGKVVEHKSFYEMFAADPQIENYSIGDANSAIEAWSLLLIRILKFKNATI